MNPDTGKIYPSLPEGLASGEKEEDLVEIVGTPEQVEKISQAVKAQKAKQKKAKRKQVQKSRRANR